MPLHHVTPRGAKKTPAVLCLLVLVVFVFSPTFMQWCDVVVKDYEQGFVKSCKVLCLKVWMWEVGGGTPLGGEWAGTVSQHVHQRLSEWK